MLMCLWSLRQGMQRFLNFIGLAEYLETLFKRKVDLVTHEGLDRYIRENVEAEVIWVEG